MHQDPIADMLTRIKNANAMRKETVEVGTSNVKTAIFICGKYLKCFELYKKFWF